jgi:hypothetical protein
VARWSAAALVLAALAQLVAALVPSTASVTLGAALLAAGTQAVKIGVDSTLQTAVAESFRGRVFSLHDLLFNASFVLAAAVAAAILPATGDAPLVMLLVAVGYVGLAGWSLRGSSDSG